jgi:hypothetical protein
MINNWASYGSSEIARLQGDKVVAQNFGDEALRIDLAYGVILPKPTFIMIRRIFRSRSNIAN